MTAFALTLSSIIIPKWVSYDSEKVRMIAQAPALDIQLTLYSAACPPLLLRPPPTLLLSHRYLRKLPTARRLPWRGSILLLHVAIRRFPDVVRGRAPGYKRRLLPDNPLGRETTSRERMENAQSAHHAFGTFTSCEHVHSGRSTESGWKVHTDGLR